MTQSTEAAASTLLVEIRRDQRAQAEELTVIKGQLTDLPGISSRLASTRMDLRHDVSELREQVAELPGIRARLAEQGQQLVEITDQLATIIDILTGRATDQRSTGSNG